MQKIKNIIVGFFISFVGSIPLGYLNIIGFEIYSNKGFQNTIQYLLGVVIIEGIVIYTTIVFANFLTQQKTWLKRIEIFTILFLLILGFSFLIKNPEANSESIYTTYLPFFTGLILSSLNFIQIPFWTGWNLYLITNKYIKIEKSSTYFYIFGTLIGTFFGMLLLILGLHYFSKNNSFMSQNAISIAFPILFFGMALFQIIKFIKKYYVDPLKK